MDRFSIVFICLNVLTISALISLLAVGVYFNVNKFLVYEVPNGYVSPTNLYRITTMDSASWNVGCTVIGTAIGLLAAVTFERYDAHLTRHEIASDSGVNVVFLRPLTLRRGTQQILRGQFRVRRMLLYILIVITALTSTAVVAMLSIRPIRMELVKSNASYPLSFVAPNSNCTFFRNEVNGSRSTFHPSSDGLLPVLQMSQLGSFLYRIAYNAGLRLNVQTSHDDLSEHNTLGEVTYNTFSTGGFGVNLTSYTGYSGTSEGYSPPPIYEFYTLGGYVICTNVTVQCSNVTSQYNISSQDLRSEDTATSIAVDLQVSKSGVQQVTFKQLISSDMVTAIGSAIPSKNDSSIKPQHTLIIPYSSFSQALVLECSYTGYDWSVIFSYPGTGYAIQEAPFSDPPGVEISTNFQWTLMEIVHHFLTTDTRGGLLTQALIDAKVDLNSYLTPSTLDNDALDTMNAIANLTTTIETILGQLSEGYISLLRQQFEASNIESSCDTQTNLEPSRFYLTLIIQRLGGGSYGWFMIPGLLLLGSFIGLTEALISKSRNMIKFDAQDSVQLLAVALKEKELVGRDTRVGYDGQLTVISQGETSTGIERTDTTSSMTEMTKRLRMYNGWLI